MNHRKFLLLFAGTLRQLLDFNFDLNRSGVQQVDVFDALKVGAIAPFDSFIAKASRATGIFLRGHQPEGSAIVNLPGLLDCPF